MNKTVAVVVTFNRKLLLKGCVEHLIAQEGARCDILVIDNASTDGTKESLQKYINSGEILYYNTGKNLGGAGGFNFGMKLAVQKGYSYIWLMDDDTFAEPEALKKLQEMDAKLNGKYGFLSSVVYWIDGSVCTMNRQRKTLRNPIDDYKSEKVPVIMATFVSFFIRSDTIYKFGLPISEFFIWSDDLEYSRRISRRLPCYVIPESRVIHHMESNQKVGIEQESKDRLWRYQYLYRNEVYVYRREGIKGYIYLLIRIVLHLLRVCVKGENEKKEKIGVILSSFINGFTFNPEIEFISITDKH